MKKKTCKLCDKNRYANTSWCWNCYRKREREKKEAKKLKAKVKKLTKRQKSTKYLDILWSKATKLFYGGKCEICGKTENLNSHHIFSRSNYAVRWDVENCSVLCPNHHNFDRHISAHKSPIEFIEFIKDKRGLEWYNSLRKNANLVKRDRTEMRYKLEHIIKKYA